MNKPNDYYRDLAPTKIDDVLTSHTPAIAQIVKFNDQGPLVVRALLVGALHNLNEYFNVTKPLTEAQAVEIINLICERYPHYKLDDIKLIFNNMKVGRYGKNFNRIDGVVIFEAFGQYDDERMNRAEALSIQQHNELKKPIVIDPAEINEEGREKIKALIKEVNANVTVEDAKPRSDKYIKRGRTEMDLAVQRWFNQFDALYERQQKGKDKRGAKYAHRQGKTMNPTEYIDFKVDQYGRVMAYLKKRKERNP